MTAERSSNTLTIKLAGTLPGLSVYLYCVWISQDQSGYMSSIGIAALLINLWIAEPIPIWLSSLLPLLLLPLHGILDAASVIKSYYNNTILLFLGGFLLAYSVEKWNLHKRIAYRLLALTGDDPKGIIAGMLLSTALLSMWISNTATAIMMLPVATSIIHIVTENTDRNVRAFTSCLLLSIAYGANIGGIATIIGTPPNIVYKGYAESLLGSELSFFKWMLIGVPLSLLMLWITYQMMVRFLFRIKIKSLPEVAAFLDQQAANLGKMSTPEKRSLAVFASAVFFWIFAQPLNYLLERASIHFKIEEYGVAMAAGLLLFLIPNKKGGQERLLQFRDMKHISWGILILFGGGMCMAKGLDSTGVIGSVGNWIRQTENGNSFILMFTAVASALFLTELMSNVALAQIYIPVIFGITGSNVSDAHSMGIPVAMACSFAFMFPISTPPNAVVFSSGKLKIKDMAIAGFWLNIAGVILLCLAGLFVIPYLF